jgi:hypothetical protein
VGAASVATGLEKGVGLQKGFLEKVITRMREA